MPLHVLQRAVWDGVPKKQADFLRLRKEKNGRELVAVAELWTHRFGWELQLILDGEFQRSQVCRSQDEVLDTVDQWKAALLEKGWA